MSPHTNTAVHQSTQRFSMTNTKQTHTHTHTQRAEGRQTKLLKLTG